MENYLTCEEVADRYKVKVTTVWGWIRAKQLNAMKFGGYYRVHPQDMKEFESARMTK